MHAHAQANGLLVSNSWAGFHVLLNPDYSSATQWRFVNRGIDEVENDKVGCKFWPPCCRHKCNLSPVHETALRLPAKHMDQFRSHTGALEGPMQALLVCARQVPAVLLVCRNSTDTAYFQRLRPYPRIALRRSHTRFKDYDKTPIGFGVVVFCIAKASCRRATPQVSLVASIKGEPSMLSQGCSMHAQSHLMCVCCATGICMSASSTHFPHMGRPASPLTAHSWLRRSFTSCLTACGANQSSISATTGAGLLCMPWITMHACMHACMHAQQLSFAHAGCMFRIMAMGCLTFYV